MAWWSFDLVDVLDDIPLHCPQDSLAQRRRTSRAEATAAPLAGEEEDENTDGSSTLATALRNASIMMGPESALGIGCRLDWPGSVSKDLASDDTRSFAVEKKFVLTRREANGVLGTGYHEEM
ncbi:unnamed protein product [Arctogadus glacialis]